MEYITLPTSMCSAKMSYAMRQSRNNRSLAEPPERLPHQVEVDPFLAAEVIVQDRLGNARALDDLADGRGRVPFRGEQVGRPGQEEFSHLPARLGRLPLPDCHPAPPPACGVILTYR